MPSSVSRGARSMGSPPRPAPGGGADASLGPPVLPHIPERDTQGALDKVSQPLTRVSGPGCLQSRPPCAGLDPRPEDPSWPAPGPTYASREEPKSGVRFQHQPDTARSEVRTRGGGAQEVPRRPPGGLSGGGSGSSRPEGRAIWQGAALRLGAGHGIGGQNEGGKPAVRRLWASLVAPAPVSAAQTRGWRCWRHLCSGHKVTGAAGRAWLAAQ